MMNNASYDILPKMAFAGALLSILALTGCAGGNGSSAIPGTGAVPSSAAGFRARPHAVCAPGDPGCFTLIKPIAATVVNAKWSMAAAQSRTAYCSGTSIAASHPSPVTVGEATLSVAQLSVTFACMQDAVLHADTTSPDSVQAGTDIYIVAVPTYASPTALTVPAAVVSGPALKNSTGTGLQFAPTSAAIPAGPVYFYFATCRGC
jgi:hypothetical protein